MADFLDEMVTGAKASPGLLKVAAKIDENIKVQAGESIRSNVDPAVVYPDNDYDAQARGIEEHYHEVSMAKEAQFKADHQVPPTAKVDETTMNGVEIMRNFANFIAHDEMAMVGVEWGKEKINWNLDVARDFIADHPWRAGLAVAGASGPLFAGAKRIARVVSGGADAAIDSGRLLERGLIDNIADFDKLSAGAKKIVNGQADRIADIAEMQAAIKNGTATPIQQMKASFHSSFGNAYLDDQAMERMSPYSTLKEWAKRSEELVAGKTVTNMLDMADNVPTHEGTSILHALKDPKQLAGLSNQAKAFALAYGDEARNMQKQLLAEGFIDQETADKIGDVWFSTLRTDTPMFEEGATTAVHSVIKRRTLDPEVAGSLRVINIPRTGSANLKERALDSTQVTSLIKRQRAAEALTADKPERALALLKHAPEEAEAINLIKSGRHDDAKALLGREGFIGSNPKDMVVKSMLQQKLLFENFKTLREVAMNPNMTKTFEEVQAMSSTTRKRMMSLDRMENASVLRRMVAKKMGKTSVDKLGYVHESMFEALADVTNENTISSGISLLEVGTAILKTMKTSANPFTHLQNIVGNMVFLHMAGFNAFNPKNAALIRTSWTAAADWQKARKTGASVAEIRELGKLKSNVKGAADIDIASELMNPLLSGEHGILDMSSMEASEGIPMLGKLARSAGDEQMLAKGLIKGAQKLTHYTGIEKMADVYMAEDSSMKLAYYLHLRTEGLNPLAAANEVAKRLPMYGTVGGAVKRGRKVLFPWASFPTEATRIMKNNMIDHPFRTAGWMHAPNLVQAGMAQGPQAFGGKGMSYEEVESRKEQNPNWAQKLTSVVTPFRDKNDDVRTMLMDFLPMSAMLPPTVSETADWRESLPYGAGNPAPIVTGFVDALMGRGSFGQEIPVDPNNLLSRPYSVLTSTIGMLAPPLVQRYLFDPNLPNQVYRAGIDTGNMIHPSTGKTGDWLYDAVLNNFAVKNYAGSAQVETANKRYGLRESQTYRGRLGKEFNAWVSSGSSDKAADTLRDVYQSFLGDTPENPGLAHQNYIDWVKLHSREIMKDPALRGISKEQLLTQISAVGDSTAGVINDAQQEYLDLLVQGYRGANRPSRKQDGSNPLTRGNRGVDSGRGGRGVGGGRGDSGRGPGR
jgi:hypothetical protein